jgi:CHAT domain-containing protein/predicted negative regulator of RcsB-dependent stress response
MNQGNVHLDRGEYDTALARYEEAQAIFEKSDMKDKVALCVMNRGVLHRSRGEYDTALVCFKQAQTVFVQLDVKVGVADCMMNQGNVHLDRGEYDTALARYEEAQAIFEKLDMKDTVALCMMNQGAVHDSLGNYDAALACFKQAQTVFVQLGMKAGVADCMVNQGEVYLSIRKYNEALECYNQAQVIYEELGIKDWVMDVLRGKGDVYRLIEKRDAALQCYTQAKEERPIGELWYPEIQWQVRYGIAKIFSSTRQALDHYDESIAIIDTLRRRQQTDWTKMGILYNKEGVYAETILWCLEQRHEASPSPGLSLRGRGGYEVDYLPKAFDYTERAKARALLDLIDQTQPVLKSEDAKVQTHLNILRQHQTEQQRRREAEKFSEAAELSTDIQQQQEEMAELSFEDASLTVGRVRDIETIQKALPEDGALVEFYYQGETQVAFLLTNKNLQAFHLQLDTVLPKLPRLRQAIQGREPLDDVQATLVELFNVLFKQSGIWNNLEGFERLILVPHGELHGVPFAALYDKEGGQYLIEQKILSVVPSASILDVCRLKNSNRRQESCLWVYAPQTKPESKLSSMDKDMKRYGKPYDGLSEMFNELQTVTGTEATIEGITALLSERPWNVVHFYCHAKAHLDNPMLSFIELSDTSGGTPRAAFLQAKDIFNLPMKNASLAVLGACETAVGARRPGDDIVSLTRAFFRAGTPSVLASLWRVPARETAKLLKNFYLGGNSGWLSGVDQAVALQSAQQEIIVEGRHPYYWAGFVLYGDWS